MNEVARLQSRQRTLVAVDIEGTTRTNPVKASLRADMYDLLKAALLECSITEDLHEPFLNTGDGVLLLVHPADSVPKTLLLHTFVPALSEMLAEHAKIHPDRNLRLRVAIHAGDVHFDRQGVFGEDVDITFRLLQAPELKQHLRQTTAPLALAVSDDIHRSVVRHGYAEVDIESFQPLIQLNVGGQPYRGWLNTADESMASDRFVPTAAKVAGRTRAREQVRHQSGPDRRSTGAAAPTEGFLEEATGQRHVDRLLRLAGEELDAQSDVQWVNPRKLLDRLGRPARRVNLHGAEDETG